MKKVIHTTGSLKPDLEFKYNSSGQRYCKIVKPRNSGGILNQGNWVYTYYTHDAQGNIMGMYTLDYEKTGTLEFDENYKIANFNLYGSSRLGIKNDTVLLHKRDIDVDALGIDSSFVTISGPDVNLPALDTNRMSRITGYKNYEISNHLGNVLATVTDRKVPIPTAMDTIVDYWTADINTLTDYYPFGSEMPGRNLDVSECETGVINDTIFVIDEDFSTTVNPLSVVTSFNSSTPGYFVWINNTSGSITGGEMKFSKTAGGTQNRGVAKNFQLISGVTYTITFKMKKTGTDNVGARYGYRAWDANSISTTIIPVTDLAITTSYNTYTYTFTASSTVVCSFVFWSFAITPATVVVDDFTISYVAKKTSTVCNSNGSYLFGFNGTEKDNDVYGEGNAYTAEYWEYDARTGRRWNIDPVTYPHQSPYACFNNNPIYYMDPLGLEAGPGKGKVKAGAEETADLKYLCKTDKDFRKKYNQWKRDAKKNGEDLNVVKTQAEGTSTLNTAEPTKVNTESGEQANYLYYTAIEGNTQGTYYITQIVFTQTVTSGGYSASSLEDKPFNETFKTDIPGDIFKEWKYSTPQSSPPDIQVTINNQSTNGTTYNVSGSVLNNQPPDKVAGRDHMGRPTGWEYHDVPVDFRITAIAHSIPIVVKVPIGKLGKRLWGNGILNYKLNNGEKKGGTITEDFYFYQFYK